MFLYQVMQISNGGALRFNCQHINYKQLWSVELHEEPSWGNVKYLYKKDITNTNSCISSEIKTYDMFFELPHLVTEQEEIAYYDNLETAIYYAMLVLNKNK